MQVGIDSYSYHRRYGETRPGETPFADPWPLGAEPVIDHALALGADVLFLETCYLPEPDVLRDEGASRSALTIRFSWGHPWPSGQHHGLDGGRSWGAEQDLARWIDAAAGFGHDVLRITGGSPASRGDEPAQPRPASSSRSRTTVTSAPATSSSCSSASTGQTWASASTT
jgi:hypothetical protein